MHRTEAVKGLRSFADALKARGDNQRSWVLRSAEERRIEIIFRSFEMLVFKWGNDLAVKLPKALVDQLGLKEGDEVNVVAASDGTVEFETREAQRQRALDHIAQCNWPLPEGYKFDRDEANER
jgi:antitoxin MazE